MRKIGFVATLSFILVVGGVFVYAALPCPSLFARSGQGQDGSVLMPTASLTPTLIPTASGKNGGNSESNTCSNLLVLVDKTHALPASYVPPDLVYLKDYAIPVNNYSIMGRRVMIDDLQKLIADSTNAGVHLVAASVYRSYADQESIYNNYERDYGETKANIFSAKPGESQHQLGTAIDFTSPEMGYGLSQTFAYSGAGKWLLANAYKYGFYLSYSQGQERVTGYEYEPWHFRYLGVQNAQDLQQSGLIMQIYLERRYCQVDNTLLCA